MLIPKHAGREHLDVNGRRLLESHAVQQALDRTELITLVVGGREGLIPRPTLYGSVIGKAAAFSNEGDTDKRRHAEDLVELLSMLEPADLETKLRPRDMVHMQRAQGFLLRDASPYDSSPLREQLSAVARAFERQQARLK